MNIAMKAENFIAVNSFITNLDFDGTEVLRVIKDPKIEAFDEPTYARVIGTHFQERHDRSEGIEPAFAGRA